MCVVSINTACTISSMDEWIKAIRAELARQNITQDQLAERLGYTQGAVGHWLNGRREPKLADINRMLNELGLPGLSIGGGNIEPANISPAQAPDTYPYPVISSVVAGNWAEAEEPWPLGEADDFEYSSYRGAGLCFWLLVKGDSMTAPFGDSFPDGTLVLVDTGLEALPGRLVVAKRVQDNEATFKQLVSDAGQLFLKPLNPAYPILTMDQETKLIGVVKESRRRH